MMYLSWKCFCKATIDKPCITRARVRVWFFPFIYAGQMSWAYQNKLEYSVRRKYATPMLWDDTRPILWKGQLWQMWLSRNDLFNHLIDELNRKLFYLENILSVSRKKRNSFYNNNLTLICWEASAGHCFWLLWFYKSLIWLIEFG